MESTAQKTVNKSYPVLQMLAFAMVLLGGSVTKRVPATAPRRSNRLRGRAAVATSSATPPASTTPTSATEHAPRTAKEHAAGLYGAIQGAADAARAEQMSRYMKGHFAFFGVPTLERRRLTQAGIAGVRRACADAPTLALDVCTALWAYEQREAQYVALDVLDRCAPHWARAPAPVVLRHVEHYVHTRPWWDTIDMLASHTVRDAHRAHPQPLRAALERWVASDHMWTRRTAIIWQLGRKRETDTQMLFRFIDLNIADEEWFIRKAIGWALRQYRRTDPQAVDRYVQDNIETLSKLSVREAWKHKA